jgi:hypothetical protein
MYRKFPLVGLLLASVLALSGGCREPREGMPMQYLPPDTETWQRAEIPSLSEALANFSTQRDSLLADIEILYASTNGLLQAVEGEPPRQDSLALDYTQDTLATEAEDKPKEEETRSQPADDSPQAIVADWERRWEEVLTRLKQLRQSLEVVRQARDAEFQRMNQTTAYISNDALRRREFRKNSQAYARFNQQYKNWYRQIARMQAMVHKGKDLRLVLRTALLRQKFSEEGRKKLQNYLSQSAELILDMEDVIWEAGLIEGEISKPSP